MDNKGQAVIKVLGIVGLGLGFVGSVISAIASNKSMKSTVAEEVAKATANTNN